MADEQIRTDEEPEVEGQPEGESSEAQDDNSGDVEAHSFQHNMAEKHKPDIVEKHKP